MGTKAEIKLGLYDVTAGDWLRSAIFRANQVTTSYSWLRVATDVAPAPDHNLLFLAQFSSRGVPLTTDWFIDEAVVMPAGVPPPSVVTADTR
jgi:hypothetical protein